MFQQLVGRLAGAPLEARLHRPQIAHVGRDTALQRQFLGLRVEHIVGGQMQGWNRIFAGGLVGIPFFDDLVPQQRGKQEAGRNRFAFPHALVGIGQRQRDKFFAERLLQNHVEQRQQAVMQAFLAELLQAGEGMAAHQQLEHFIEHACGRHIVDEWCHHLDRLARRLVDGELQLGGKAHHAQQAHRVFAIAGLRYADHAQLPVANVLHTMMIVEHRLAGRVVIHRVDGEIAPGGVLMLFTEGVVAQDAAVLVLRRIIRRCAAEGGDLDDLLPEHHVHDLETLADDKGAPEQALDLFRRGIGGHVEILRLDAQQQVAHRAAHDEGLEAGFLQRLRYAHRIRRQQLRIDAVLLRSEHDGLDMAVRLFLCAEYALDKLFNHRTDSGWTSPALAHALSARRSDWLRPDG